MAFDVFSLPILVITMAAELSGHHGQIEIGGSVVPLPFVVGWSVMAIFSVVGVAAIALQTNAIGFGIVTAVALAWVVFLAVAWIAGVSDLWAIAGRVVILGLLLWGRGPFLPETTRKAATAASSA